MTLRRIFIGALVTVFFGACIFTLFLPFPRRAGMSQEVYVCVWEDGSRTDEDYFGAFSALRGATEEGLVLDREGKTGLIQTSEEFRRAVTVFEYGKLAELLSFRAVSCTRLEKAALFLRYGERCYYAGERFCWDGEKISRSERTIFTEVVLLDGDLPRGFLCDTGAKMLILSKDAAFTVRSLVESRVENIVAFSPYSAEDGALYLETSSGRRLVAVLPNVEYLEINCDYIDKDALSACTQLKALKLPENFDGTLAMLFGDTPVPEDLVLL